MSATDPRPKKLPFLLVVIAIVAGLLSSHSLWTFVGIAPDALEYGAFEARDGKTALFLRRLEPELVFHKPGLDARGRVSIPPGTVVAAPLWGAASYRITADALVPYLVIGRASAGVIHEDERRALESAVVLNPSHAGLGALIPWRVDAPWRLDSERLSALGKACNIPAQTGELTIARQGDSVALTLGTCATVLPLPEDLRGDRTVIAVAAGPSWAFLEGAAEPIARQRIWFPKVIAALLTGYALITLGLGRMMAVVLGVFVTGASPFQPAGAAICLALVAMIALLVLVARALAYALDSARARQTSAALALFGMLVLVSMPSEPTPPPLRARAQPGCVLSGYSMAEGDSLYGRKGVFELLQDIPVCSAWTRRYARSAETFHFIDDLICNDRIAWIAGDKLLFLGAANDDLMFSANESDTARLLSRAIFFGRAYFQQRPGMDALLELIDASSRRSLDLREAQRTLLNESLTCAADRRVSFYFLHDFLAPDIAKGRSPARQALLEMRRAAVEKRGVFVDLLQVFSDDVGVAWFADFIHLSQVGHQQVARLLRERFQTADAIHRGSM